MLYLVYRLTNYSDNKIKKEFKRLLKLTQIRSVGWLFVSAISVIPIQQILNLIINLNEYIFKFFNNILITLSGVHKDQLWKERETVMEDYIKLKKISRKNINILEIGSWFGLGSTQKFIKHMDSTSHLFLVDPWEIYSKSDELTTTSKMNLFVKSAYNSVYDQVIKNKKNIFIIKAQIEKLEYFLKKNYFDYIYIDGSHYYHSVLKDIEISKKILKRGGIISGDDLDLGIDKSLYKVAKENIEKDLYVFNDGRAFHPGVYLAVYRSFSMEERSRIYTKNGFWAIEFK